MYKIREKSKWKVDGSVSTGLSFLFASGGKGTINLVDPDGDRVDFPYGYGGAGYSIGVKYDPKDKFGSDDFALSLPIDLPNAGAIYMLDSFKGDELTMEDFSGICFIGEISLGAVAMTLSATGMLLGIPPSKLPKELAMLGLHQSMSSVLIGILEKKIKQVKSSAKAVLWLSGINAGLSLSAGITGSLGYIGEGENKEPGKIKFDPIPVEGINHRLTQTAKDSIIIQIPGDILFDWDDDKIKTGRETADALLDAKKKILSHPKRQVLIAGHTDDTEKKPGYNQGLSERRARSVQFWFMGAGVPPTRMRTRGFGATKPISLDKTEKGRKLNRRVEVHLLPD